MATPAESRRGDAGSVSDPRGNIEPRSGFTLSAAASVTGILSALSAPLVALLFAGLRIAHEEFYSQLGVTPDAIGLSQSGTLARAGAMFGILALVATTWVAAGLLTYSTIAPVVRVFSHERSEWKSTIAWVACIVPMIILIVVLGVVIDRVFGPRILPWWLAGSVPAAAVGYLATGSLQAASSENENLSRPRGGPLAPQRCTSIRCAGCSVWWYTR